MLHMCRIHRTHAQKRVRLCQLPLQEVPLTEPSAKLARWMARFGLDRSFRPGSYRVVRSDAWNLARQLRTVRPLLAKVTILPGADVFSLRDLFRPEQNPDAPGSGDLLKRSILDGRSYPEAMRAVLPDEEESRIAWLLPDTYLLVEESPEEQIGRAHV